MHIVHDLVLFLVLLCCFPLHTHATGEDTLRDHQLEVSMRTLGHEVMMAHGDSTSRVLPVQQEGDQYVIQFDSEFQFNATKLITAVNDVVIRTELASHYIVGMRDEETQETIYSYEVDGALDFGTIPCASREQPQRRYSLLFTIMDDDMAGMTMATPNHTYTAELAASGKRVLSLIYLLIPLVVLVGFVIYRNINKSAPVDNPNISAIGAYQFDKRNMTLSLADTDIELTSKETDLLELLQLSANTTIERDVILRHVWGVKGDYIGRTLDVFISKLRKKLDGDSSVKITNIRGVGYRLVC